MSQQWIYVIIFVLCLIVSAFFSTSETAFTSSSMIRLKTAKDQGNTGARIAINLLDQFDNLLSAILIGNNFVNILASSVATLFFVNLNAQYGATVATAVSTVLVLMFAEITPKQIARIAPEKIAVGVAPLLRIAKIILSPFVWLFDQWQKLVSRFVRVESTTGISEQELKTYVDEARRGGGIEHSEHRLIHTAIEFDDIEVRSILKPRTEVIGFDILTADDQSIQSIFDTHPYTRIIAYEKSIDNAIGMLTYREFHQYLKIKTESDLENIDLRDFIQEVLYVPPMITLDQLLTKMQNKNIHMAVIVDEYGGMRGIATLEDIIEVLVGDIWDETDRREGKTLTVIEEDRSYRAAGRYPLEQLFAEIGLETTDTFEAKTLSGFILEQLSRIPQTGDTFTYENFSFTITDAKENFIEEVLIQKTNEEF